MRRTHTAAILFALATSFPSVHAQLNTEYVTLDSLGEQILQNSFTGAISGDGRFVLFVSRAPNLIDQDRDGIPEPDLNGLGADFFVRDLSTGITELVNANSAGEQANGGFGGHVPGIVDISGDGRFVVFSSPATNLIDSDGDGLFDEDANGDRSDVFVRDRVTGTTELVSVNSLGEQGNGASAFNTISRDGRYVLFSSNATNLTDIDADGNIDTDANGTRQDLFLRDRQTGVTEIVSVNSLGVQANDFSASAGRISDDGRYVAFASRAPNLIDLDGDGVIDPDTNSFRDDIFVRDRSAGITEIVSVNNAGEQHNNLLRGLEDLDISADGRFVVFSSTADNLIDRNGDGVTEPDLNGFAFDVFIRDREAGTTDIVSLDVFGEQGIASSLHPRITADGTQLVFASQNMLVDRDADGRIDADDNGANQDVYILDRNTGTLEIVSSNANGAQGNDGSSSPVLSDDGRAIAYATEATNLVDRNGDGVFDDDQTPSNQDIVVRVPAQSEPPPPVPPTVEIDSPADGAVVMAGDVIVAGIASDDVLVDAVTVNGVVAGLVPTNNPDDPVEVAFSAVVELAPGQQLISAVATDGDGNTSVAGIEVQVELQALVCDVDGNRVVDRNDIGLIFAARGQAADGPNDPRDANGDGVITINDGRACVLECSNPGCAP